MKIIKDAVKRTEQDRAVLRETVRSVIENVMENGDAALKDYSARFDGCNRSRLLVSRAEIENAYNEVSEEELNNMKIAASNIRAFAKAQLSTMSELHDFSPMPGISLGHKIIPIDSCCCYIPGGSYPLYSTALMLGIPASVAGVKRRIACTPVMKGTDRVNPKTLVAMDIAGIQEIYAVGGAQAIAAVAYGTEEIKAVDIVVGPGNSYVTEAKRQCYGRLGIDFLAGPSEVLIIADKNANPDIIAADLLAQSEHDREAKGILVTTDEGLAAAVILAVEKELEFLSTSEIARDSWDKYGEIILVDSFAEAVEITNELAPEHLEVNIADEGERDLVIAGLRNYGSLFIGENTAEVFGDYASGTNHTLPTLTAARYTGGVWVGTFLKTCTYQSMTRDAMKNIAPVVESLAKGEGLMGHAYAASVRCK